MSYRRELSERSPLRVLDRSMRGGLGAGNLGVVCGAAGLGKSAFLVDVALDELIRGREVVWVALDHTAERVRHYFEEIFGELVRAEEVGRPAEIWRQLEEGLRIQAYQGAKFRVETLARTIEILNRQTATRPDLIVVDGYDFSGGRETEVRELKSLARACQAEIWMSATVREDFLAGTFGFFPEPIQRYGSLVDVLLHLEGHGSTVHLHLLKDHDNPSPNPVALDLNPTTLLLVRV